MYFDTHVHSYMSDDSDERPEVLIEAARQKGLGVIFTEHYDKDVTGYTLSFCVDTHNYMREYERFRGEDALLGIEIGLTEKSRAFNAELARSHDFDFVIGSVHLTEKADIYIDYNLTGKPPVITPADYFDTVLRMSENAFYDSLGHIDYPHRYAAKHNLDFSFETHKAVYDKIFKNLIEQDIALEINTRRLSDYAAFSDMRKVYARYAALGGRSVTIGSDAHSAAAVGVNFNKALWLTRVYGLTVVHYKRRKRVVS